MNENVLKECKNSLMIPQLLLINPSSMPSSKECFLACHVSKQTKLKDALKSRLSRTNLDKLLRINKKGPDAANFDAKENIDHWFGNGVRRLTSSLHRYPEKRKHLNDACFCSLYYHANMPNLEDEESLAFDDCFCFYNLEFFS